MATDPRHRLVVEMLQLDFVTPRRINANKNGSQIAHLLQLSGAAMARCCAAG